jgi:hypothetical protein
MKRGFRFRSRSTVGDQDVRDFYSLNRAWKSNVRYMLGDVRQSRRWSVISSGGAKRRDETWDEARSETNLVNWQLLRMPKELPDNGVARVLVWTTINATLLGPDTPSFLRPG